MGGGKRSKWSLESIELTGPSPRRPSGAQQGTWDVNTEAACFAPGGMTN